MKFLKYLLVGASAIAAQSAHSQIIVGPEVGLTYSTMNAKIDNKLYENKFVTGARAGLTFDIEVDDKFYIQPALALSFLHGAQISHRSYKSAGNGVPTITNDDREYNIYAVNIPVYFVHKVNFQYHPNTLTFGIGPVLNFNYGGEYTRTYTSTLNGQDRPVYDDRKIKVGPNWGEHDVRMFELSAAAMIGYEMTNKMNLRLHYGVGITNLAPGGDKSTQFRSHGGGISLSYYINKTQEW